MRLNRLLLLVLLAPALAAQCGDPREPSSGPGATIQLLVTGARVLDVRTGRVHEGRTVVVDDGRIVAIVPDVERDSSLHARDTLDARGRLLTPGLVDAHFHSGMLLGDSVTAGGGYITRLAAHPDSLRAYRRRFAEAYLPHGVTLVRDVGSAPRDFAMLRSWMTTAPDAPDLVPSGAQLVSVEPGRVAPSFHAAVQDSAAAAALVRQYAELGFRNVKLYWRLRDPAFTGALAEARRLGMTATAHVDNGIISHDRALDVGLRHFEHVHPIAAGVLRRDELDTAVARTAALMAGPAQRALVKPGAFFQYVMEQWSVLGEDDPRVLALVERMRETGSTLTPTLHVFAQRVGAASFASPPAGAFDDLSAFSPAQVASAREGYRIMARYVALMDARGVRLAVGSDTEEPGRAVLSEIMLLHDAGIPMWRVLRIATLYSAEAVGRGEDYGALEPGRRADMVLFADDPLVNPRALLGSKTVIKAGVVSQ